MPIESLRALNRIFAMLGSFTTQASGLPNPINLSMSSSAYYASICSDVTVKWALIRLVKSFHCTLVLLLHADLSTSVISLEQIRTLSIGVTD